MRITDMSRRIRFLPGRFSIFGIGLLLLNACSGGHAEDDLSEIAEKATNVTVRTIVAEDLRESFTLPGGLEAWEDLTLAAELAGVVRWIGPKEGERVREGEAILRIDPEAIEAALARDRADFELQKRQLARLEELAGSNFVSRQELDQARRAYEVAEAEMRRSRVALEKSTLRSPISGILDRLMVDRGEYVTEGAPVATIVQVDRLKVNVEVPEKDVSFLRAGDQVRVVPALIQGGAAQERAGEVLHLSYKADPATRTYLARVAVDNAEGELRPGMIVRVGLVRRVLQGVIAVPLYTVVDRAGKKVVFVEEEGVARLRHIGFGPVIGDRVVITDGLAAGERLIIEGQQFLTDGAAVTPKVQDRLVASEF
jgi:membrane fusion protein, multidrug efflux system